MTGHSHDVEIELPNNSSDGEDGYQNLQESSSGQGQALSPGQDFPDEFKSCNESLTPRHSLEQDRSLESSKLLEGSGKQPSSLATSANHAPLEPSLKVTMAEDSADDTLAPKLQKTFEPIYVGGLKVIREIDSDSARSPTLASSAVPISCPVPEKTKSQGSTSLLDRFGRDVRLHRNQEDEMDEVRVDEDGNYYVFGDEGFRVRLKEGQIQSDNTSQPFCISNGIRVNISVVADRLRNTALHDPRPAADELPITPPEPVINNGTTKPFPSPIRTVSKPANIQTPSRETRAHHSRNPWAGIFAGVAEKSEHATRYLTKGAHSKMRSSSSQHVQPQLSQQDTSRISSRTSSANKSGLETGDSGERRGRRLPFLN